MSKKDVTPNMQELMEQMARIQLELNDLKSRSQTLPPYNEENKPRRAVSTTRRNTLKRLGLALLGGVATAGAIGAAPVVQAKVIANPQGNGLSNHGGMLVVPPGAAAPTGTAPGYNYGLIASGDIAALNLTNLPGYNTGLVGISGTMGVYGNGDSYGIYGKGFSYGVYGNGNYSGVYGNGSSYGVYGNGNFCGVYGNSSSFGVYGFGSRVSGLFGSSTGSLIGTSSVGVIGSASNADFNLGGFGANTNTGIYGYAGGNTTNFAGYFAGNVVVTGSVSKGGGSFKIDHPLEPTNKFLYHSFVESPDMMNIYNGLVILDDQGEATVEMPAWFEALNSDFRYQLTALDTASPGLHIAGRLQDKRFKVGGGQPGQEVSWQITGIRQDAWANANRIIVEQDKLDHEKGKYLHPEVFGQPE
jgi:hypothetical protein